MCITFLLFLPWKKGPAFWTKISPFIFFAVALLNYLVIPLVNIFIAIFCFTQPKFNITEATIETYVLFIFVICITRVVEYFTLFRRNILVDAKIYLQSKCEFAGQTTDQLKALIQELRDKTDQISIYKLKQL